jgi:signal transduction histidine kinase
MKDESGQVRAIRENSNQEWRTATAAGMAESVSWILMGLVLDMGIRAVWLHFAVGLPDWGGLFLDMTGVLVVGLARGRGAACSVVILNQMYRMAFGQVSNAFVLVEIAGGLFWGTLAARHEVVLDRRRPLALLRTFLLASLGGGAVCALAAWLTNLVLRGQWDFMPVQQQLYQTLDLWDLLKAIPTELGISIWDKTVTAVLGFAVLVGLRELGSRVPALSPSWWRTLRNYPSVVATTLTVLIAWGSFLSLRLMLDLLSPPMVMDFLLFRQSLIVNAAYLLLTVVSTASLVRWRRASLNRLSFSLSWISVALGGLLFFFSGIYFAAHSLSWSTFRAAWSIERQVLATRELYPSVPIPKGMALLYLREAAPASAQSMTFTPAWKVSRHLTWGDLEQVSDTLFPPHEASNGAEVDGYLRVGGELQLAVLKALGPGGRGPVLIYQEAPWLFSHGSRDQLVPTVLAFGALFLLMALLFALLARQMMVSSTEAILSRKARALALRIRTRNKRLEVLQVQLEGAVAQREARIRELANLAEVGKAVGILAHEIRNPIGTIQMAFGNLLEAMGTHPKGELAEQVLIIERQIRHMNTLTQSVLAFSRGASENRERGLCLASSVVANCQALFAPAAAKAQVTFTAEAPVPDIAVFARENEAIQILQNLILNAIESFSGGEQTGRARSVTLSVGRDLDTALFVVADTGPGLRPGEAERVFDLFYSQKTQGTGLGLFVARELARMLRGDLSVESEGGDGCRFLLRLPAADQAAGC